MAGKNGNTRKPLMEPPEPVSKAVPNIPYAQQSPSVPPGLTGPVENPGPLVELGTTGLLRTGNRGFIYEEFLRDLAGQRARQVFREMRDNDNIVGAILFAIEMMVRSVTWRIEGDDNKTNDFVESCMEDMSHTWEDMMAEILSEFTYGWSWHEVVYKKRGGESDDPTQRSRFKDGKIGWRKIPIRAQETLWEWLFDDEGGVQGVVQVAPPFYKRVDLPINRCLLFRVGVHKGNPEGRSLLRNSYRPWYFKRRIEEIEAIGVERDLAGLPVIYRDGTSASQYDKLFKEILKNIRRDEQEGILLPLMYDDKGNKLVELTLLSSPGPRQMNVSNIIDRYNKAIAMTVLADFLMLGQSSSSSGSKGGNVVAESKQAMFGRAIEAILHTIAAVFNRHAIPKLLSLNSIDQKKAPSLVPGPVYSPDLTELAAFITALAGAGAALFPDDDLENYLRGVAYLPEKSEDAQQQTAVPSPGTSQVPGKPGTPPGEQPQAQPAQVQPPKKPGAKLPPGPKAPNSRALRSGKQPGVIDSQRASGTSSKLPEDAAT